MARLASFFLLLIALAAPSGVAAQTPPRTSLLSYETETVTAPLTLTEGKYAVFHTSEGDVIAKLADKEAPKTVENFVALATGRKKWTHPITMATMDKPLYNNTTIYEVIRDIAVRGGDPINKGNGGPGWVLDLETNSAMAFDAPGLLAMQPSGQKANGSRFFITLTPFPDWNGRFTIFGRVIGGLDTVRQISRTPTKRPTIPLEPVLLNSIEILDIPAGEKTPAKFVEEDGRRMLTVERDMALRAGAPPAAGAETTGTAAADATTTKP